MINYGFQKSVRRELNLTRGKTLIRRYFKSRNQFFSRNSTYITIRRLWLISWSMNFNDYLY